MKKIILKGNALIENRYYNISLYEKVSSFLKKLYLVVFEKEIDGKVEKFIKVGTTDYKEFLDRFIFNHHAFTKGFDDWVKTSMYLYFDTLMPHASVQNKKEIIDTGEQDILKAWRKYGPPADLPKMSGMSEIFPYTKQRAQIARDWIDKNRWNG
jgi:hypothetical protein